MPTSYEDAYESLRRAQEGIAELKDKPTKEEKYACLRVSFYRIYQAANIANMCYEASCFEGYASQGGATDRIWREVSDFLHASRYCHTLLDLEDDESIVGECEKWLVRARSFVDAVKAEEAKSTNLQYARMPEQQDWSLITKDGVPLKADMLNRR